MKNNLMKIRNLVLLIISLVLLFLIFIISLSVGSEKISFFSAMKHFSEATDSLNFDYIILFELRLPRCLLAMISGALLAGAGAVFQMFFRNPLAEPGIIGISSGATLGAVVSQSVFNVTAITVAFSSVSSFFKFCSPISLFAFVGALIAGLIVTSLSFGKSIRESSYMLLICGTALGTLYSSISSIILLTTNKELHSIYTWILGSFNGRGWNEFYFTLPSAIISVIIMFSIMSSLDLLSSGQKNALSLGVNVKKLRILVLISGALAVSVSVCAGGTINFVGLIAPHIVRKFTSSKGKTLIPFSMIFGAIILLISDTIARTVIAPSELPAGIITSILGVPFFLSLIIKKNR